MEHPQDAIDQGTRIVKRMAHVAVMGSMRKKGRDPVPLSIREFMAVHSRPPAECGCPTYANSMDFGLLPNRP